MNRAPSNPAWVLQTERLAMREFRGMDIVWVENLFADRQARRFFPTMVGPRAAARWIAANQRRYRESGLGLWAVLLLGSFEPIGDCGLTIQNLGGLPRLEVGYHLIESYRGHGYATEAARACVRYAFDILGAREVVSIVDRENQPSRRVAQKVHSRVESGHYRRRRPVLLYRTDRIDDPEGSASLPGSA